MALFLEYSDKVKNRKYPITRPVRQHAGALYNALEKIVPKNNLKGLKDLATLKKYNIKGANSKNNGENTNIKYITTDDAIKRLQRKGYGVGDAFIQNFLKKCVDKSTSQEEVSPVEPPKPTSNAVKPPEVKTKTIKGSNGTVSYTENRIIKETSNDEEHIFYEYLEDYDVYYVLDDFFNNPKGKQDWGVLINPDMYAKALREFTKYGKLINFPSKYVYQWMGIIMKNTAILEVNSALAGHREYSFYYEISEYANDHFGEEVEPDYESCYNWLEEKGIYDWMEMPDGHFAVTDYGTEPLFKIIKEYNENLPPEKVLVLVNRALDVYHMQGPICSIFIQGGTTSLNKIAEETELNKGKKVYLSEESLKRLYEYHSQLKIPFNDPSKPYDDKQNYEHFVDWLEYVGRYGQLEPSDADVYEMIEESIDNGFYRYMNNDMEDDNFTENARMVISDLFSGCNDDEDYLRLYFNLPEEWYTNPPYDIIDYLDEMGWAYDVSEMKKVLTDEGIERFNEEMRECFRSAFETYEFPNALTIDDRGLIYIEREITLPDIFSTQVATHREDKDYFELLKNVYKGSGPCWSWKVGRAEAYCAESYGTKNTPVVLKGWADPTSVDWAETLYRNAYSLNEECEIYLKEGNIIEIDEVVVNDYSHDNNGKHILNKPMLIPV